MKTIINCAILTSLITIFVESKNITLAAGEEKSYFHFPKKFENVYPIELHAEYKPIQLVNDKGLSISLVYENKGNEDIILVSDENYCSTQVFYNGESIEPRVAPSGHFKLATQSIYPRDGEIIKQGKSKTANIIIDKVIDKFKKKSPTDKKETLVKPIPSLNGIQITCIGLIFPGNQSKIEPQKTHSIYFVSESDIFYIDYKIQGHKMR